jgi:hypothetical protein
VPKSNTRAQWELYHTDVDRAETRNLAAERPDKVRELVNLWFCEAGANAALPLDDRSAVEIFNTPRPQLITPRARYVYRPGTAPISEWQAVNTKGRSFVIGALVDIPAPGAEGVLFTGGTIDRVAVDVSGEPYMDLEREAALMIMRE